MKYMSIDLETTGLDPEKDLILQVGAIIDDGRPLDKLPKFEMGVRYGRLVGDMKAISLNHRLIHDIMECDDSSRVGDLSEVMIAWHKWAVDNGMPVSDKVTLAGTEILQPITAAGKNFGSFDRQFIKHQMGFLTTVMPFHHRSLDVGSMYVAWNDVEIPKLEECKRRAGIEGIVMHTALADAMDVVQLVRAAMDRRGEWVPRS